MPGGWLLRGIHHYMAQLMVPLLVLHFMQVLIDGAYKAPREFNYWFGLGLLGLTLGISLTGYLLPWDQRGYWSTKVVTNLAGNVPVIGDSLQRVVVGDANYGHHTLTRFFAPRARASAAPSKPSPRLRSAAPARAIFMPSTAHARCKRQLRTAQANVA